MAKGANLVRFPRAQKDSFRSALTQRVKDYFEQSNISSKANNKMVVKTIGMMALYFVPYLFLIFSNPGVWAMFGLFILMGFGMSGIGMGVMHDANHGAYHSNRRVNQWLGGTMYLISGNVANWKVQHNILHHTFTNIEGLDEDMESSGLIRLHPSQEWKRFHRFQRIYSPFVYGLLTLNWVMLKDFKQLVRYYRRGVGGHSAESIKKEWTILVITKVIYFTLFVALPLIMIPVAWYWILLGFVLMHFTAGVVLSYVFQMAHMVEGVENMDVPEGGMAEDEWMEHQLKTTANFAQDSKIINWFVGGLNYQVEHHLFPTICHVHYPAISKIVKETAAEFNLPYMSYQKFSDALKAHVRHLGEMGKKPQSLTASTVRI